MTPEEQKLVAELFDRLATLESTPRDPDALRLMQDGLRKAPNALYPLVQTVLVQDEALKQANAHIQQLEQELGYGQEPQRPPGGFLDNMRSALFGRPEPAAPPPSQSKWGSVPSVRPGGAQGYQQEQPSWGAGPMGGGPMAGGPMGGQYPGQMPMGGGFGGGGSFLGTAAASAAGVIGGALMMDSIRSMMGHRGGGVGGAAGGAGGSGSAHAAASPWNSDASGGELSRDAGVNDIGRSGSGSDGGGSDGGSSDGGRGFGLFGGNDDPQSDSNDAQYDVAEDDDGGFDGDDGGDDNA